MSLKAKIIPYRLDFNFLAITSRASMTYKDTFFIILERDGRYGVGECALFRGLSSDDRPDYEDRLRQVCKSLENGDVPELTAYPSIRFGVETAIRSLESQHPFVIFPSAWTEGETAIKINGLVWMGSAALMRKRVREKLEQGFRCIKLKIGGVDFEQELDILKSLRTEFSPADLEIRLDANGAFTPENALARIERLSQFSIHSLEQPIKAGQMEQMANICRKSPIDIALDEELIGVNNPELKSQLLEEIRPRYVILKPALTGGFSGADEWISLAEGLDIGWWATSALESNIGLNAIAQWCFTKNPSMPQGLGTGMLFTNNIPSPLRMRGDTLVSDSSAEWELPSDWL